jgi:hypothetical protein
MFVGLALACSDADQTEALSSGRYVISTTIFQPDGQTSLIALVDDPAAAAELNTERAIEIGGSAALFGVDGRSVFALGSSDAPVVTRYELSSNGELSERARMSLEGMGISSAFKRPELVPFVSDTKAYWLDDTSAQAVVWNPQDMTLGGAFSLAAAQREGHVLELGEAVLRAGLLFVSAQHRTTDDGEAGRAMALVIDTERDALLELVSDERCGGTMEIAVAGDGTLYFASDAFSASLHALGRPESYPAPCILRIPPGEQRFDPDFYIALPELVEGRHAGRLVMGQGGQAFVLALHEELLDDPLGPETDLFVPWESSAWRWWRVELGQNSTGTRVEEAPVGSAASRVLRAGGHEFISHANIDAGTTTLLVPQADGSLQPGLEMTGYPYGLIELR